MLNKAPTPCEGNDDCLDFGNDSTCGEDGFCICNSSKICIGKTGVVVTKVGLECVRNNDCKIEQAECSDGKCMCKTEHVASPDEKTCLKISEGIGSSCEDSVQCYSKIQFSGCQHNKCVCQQHTHEYNGSCYRDVELDQNCNNDGECAFVPFSECLNSKCSCMKRYVASIKGSRCLPLAEGLRSSCVDNAQCTEILGSGSECSKGICDCKEMYQFNNKTNKCIIDILLGEICQKHSDCHEPLREASRLECILGECKCKSFYTEVNGYCISSSENQIHSLIIIIFHVVFLRIFL
ncbi:prion-like-(Q/N-rich) domain-bearing protein 25 [Anoplophora glabripennis]|uniref:prion-like-(Q/N-rich) domain-bearing protein 25 n=1 Tax=Anoplophora glabripennis TaxID=217634 RepID=UPI000873BF2F|nr:prion-like-(Q/N-rich) domain-bearing protein 25 [Anoplophora glabripennis]